MGLDVWVARNDQNKSFKGNLFREVSNLRSQLPRQFDEATNRTIEFIDVLAQPMHRADDQIGPLAVFLMQCKLAVGIQLDL